MEVPLLQLEFSMALPVLVSLQSNSSNLPRPRESLKLRRYHEGIYRMFLERYVRFVRRMYQFKRA